MKLSEAEVLVHQLEPTVAELLETDLDDAREFSGVVLYAIESAPKVLDATRESLIASILTCAKMRLVPGLLGKLGYQRGDVGLEAIFSPNWRGLLQLLHDHAGVVDAWAELVYERDYFRFDRYAEGDEIQFTPCNFGPRGALQAVFVNLFIESRSGQRIGHAEVVWRADIDAVSSDGSDPPDSARGKSTHDNAEFVKTVAFKRAAKWCASRTRKGAAIIAAAIDLERGIERSRVVPSAVRIARLLGIHTPPSLSARHSVEPSPAVGEASGEAGRRLRCCGCGNPTPQGHLTPYDVHPRVWRGCQGCGRLGVHHEFCPECFGHHAKARREIEAQEAREDEVRRQNASARQAENVVAKRVRRRPDATPSTPQEDKAPESQGASASVSEANAAASSPGPECDAAQHRDREAAASISSTGPA